SGLAGLLLPPVSRGVPQARPVARSAIAEHLAHANAGDLAYSRILQINRATRSTNSSDFLNLTSSFSRACIHPISITARRSLLVSLPLDPCSRESARLSMANRFPHPDRSTTVSARAVARRNPSPCTRPPRSPKEYKTRVRIPWESKSYGDS